MILPLKDMVNRVADSEERPLAVIFDVDGLMVDTEPLSRQAWEQILAEHDHLLDESVYAGLVGRRLDFTAELLLRTYDMPLTAPELMARKEAVFGALRAQGVPVMAGLLELVEALAARGVPWGVATSSARHHAEEILAQLNLRDRCQAIAGGDEVADGKPAPDLYLLAAKRLGVRPLRCLALEDSIPGCRSALAAGMLTAAVPAATANHAQLPPVDYIFASLHEVIPVLDSLLQELSERA